MVEERTRPLHQHCLGMQRRRRRAQFGLEPKAVVTLYSPVANMSRVLVIVRQRQLDLTSQLHQPSLLKVATRAEMASLS